MLLVLFIATCFLAFTNGANDNFKGVATLFGSGITGFNKAITWATITTLAGSITAIFLAQELVKNFSGKGLVTDELIQNPGFAIAISLGAAITVFIATRIGMPISTTHSLVGALFGSGVVAIGRMFNFDKLLDTFLIPLIVSPLMAALTSYLLYILFNYFRKKVGIEKEYVHNINEKEASHENYSGSFLGVKIQYLIDSLHYLSSGVVSFARGLNDTPKIVGLLIVIEFIKLEWSMIIIAIVMAIGGIINSKKVAELMSKKITPMNSGQGFTANLITGLLVTTASLHGLPVSTTHVSVGSILGIGVKTNKANTKVIGNILMSWLLTLPIAAFFSGLTFYLTTLI